MRTLIFILAGLTLAAVVLRFAPPAHRMLAVSIFSLVWLAVAAFNLRTGLSHGYTLAQELPIHLVLWGVPVAGAWLWAWWSGRGAVG